MNHTTQIEFLPKKYNERYALRRRQLWRVVVLASFGTIVIGLVMFQYHLRKDAQRQLIEVEPKHVDAQKTNQQLVTMQAQLKQSAHQAELYTYLKHPWPRSRLLAEIARPASREITLNDVQISQDRLAAASAARPRRERTRTSENQRRTVSPAAEDLAELRAVIDPVNTVVSVSGVAASAAAVHEYVGLLGVCPLFSKAELSSLESLDESDESGSARFSIRLIVRPGYGQPSGPIGKATQERKHDQEQA